MDPNDLQVKLTPLAVQAIKSGAQYDLRGKIVEACMKTPEYEELVNSVKIDRRILEERVMDAMVKKIIEKWAEHTYENGL